MQEYLSSIDKVAIPRSYDQARNEILMKVYKVVVEVIAIVVVMVGWSWL